jgi:hypothetical protein
MTPRVLSASHHLQAVREGEPLPALNQALKEVCREHFRRIDRFIQLALLGSARCVGGRMLDTGCGVYLGSGFGPIACNVAVQEQMLRDHELPKPFDFVNTLGVSAGFYVAKNFGLTGQNLCISRRGASLEAVLTAALTDLALGAVSQALVGVVEEVTLPLTEHRLRREQSADGLAAEGSHWLLLEADGADGKSIGLQRFGEVAALKAELDSRRHGGDRLHLAHSLDAAAAGRLRQRFPDADSGDPKGAYHDNVEAAWVTEFLVSGVSGGLYLADGDIRRGFSLLHLGA